MKKTILSMFAGMLIGIVLMMGMFSILNLEPKNEDIFAQNNEIINDEENDESTYKDNIEDDKYLGLRPMIDGNPKDVNKTTIENEISTEEGPYYIKVNRQANCVTVYKKDENGAYTVPIKAMTCSVGVDNRTPLGVGRISDKYEWRLLFGNTYGHYSVRFKGHILFHSVPYMKTSNDSLKEGQFNLLGEPASLGCVRLCVEDAKWIYDNCKRGTVVEVYDSPDPGPLGKPVMPKISEDDPNSGWDPTDPNPKNPWRGKAKEN